MLARLSGRTHQVITGVTLSAASGMRTFAVTSEVTFDVLAEEPMREDCPLFGAKNCIVTPHVAWGPVETRRRLVDIAARNLEAFLAGRPQNVITK